MNIIFMLIGVSLLMALGFLLAFVWSVKSGQMEDDYTPSVRMLFEDKPLSTELSANNEKINADKSQPEL
ncbi:MAG: cbb3-type cytochrome oxidase assembly protein CcoS [Bacteroidota bacterium]|jgi:cbb3-type cytochrome oxidase maturation protein|nr:cbb3-type cytochrome oxidase assembly protein CcoS [Bacteroidota bacterium]